MVSIARGVICAWPGTAASLPAGWQRVTALDARHTRGADAGHDAGASGGASSHGHTSDPHHHGTGAVHTHPSITSANDPPFVANEDYFTINPGANYSSVHNHVVPAANASATTFVDVAQPWTVVSAEPVWFGVIWMQSDGTPAGYPINAIVWWDTSSVPTNWAQHVASESSYFKGALGAADGGATGGVTNHNHPTVSHAHNTAGHTHVMASPLSGLGSGPSTNIPITFIPGGINSPVPVASHQHTLNMQPANDVTTSDASANTGNTAIEPARTLLAAIQNTSGSAQWLKGAVVLFLGALADVPYGWALCDGSGGLVDLRSQFVKAVTLLSDVGTTGSDTTTHTHSDPATHVHVDNNGHTHLFDAQDTAIANLNLKFGTGVNAPNFGPAQHTHQMQTGLASAVTGTLPADTQDVLVSTGDLRPPFVDVLYLSAPGTMSCAITAPVDGSTITQNNPLVTWTIGGGETQASYFLTAYADDGVTVVYATGLVTSATQSATIPAGHLHQGLYYRIVVESLSTTRDLGVSAVSRVHAVFAPSPTVTGLTATAQPDDVPPSVLLGWTQGTLSGGQSYLRTNVERRVTGTTPWTVIATLPLITDVVYRDYTAIPGTAYDYAVTTVTDYGGDTLVSLEQSPPPSATLSFDGVWLHLVGTPSVALLYRAATGGSQPTQDLRLVSAWGRNQPTAHVGQQRYQEWTFVGAPTLYPTWPNHLPPPDPWLQFKAFVTAAAQGGQNGLLFVRFGQMQEGAPCVIDWTKSSRADELGNYTATLVVDETFFDSSIGG